MSDEFLLYRTPDGAVSIEVLLQEETVWLPQRALAELFGVQVPAVSRHLRNIFAGGELVETAVVSILETTAAQDAEYRADSGEAKRLQGRRQEGVGREATVSTMETVALVGKNRRRRQDAEYVSDFDREVKRLQGGRPGRAGADE